MADLSFSEGLGVLESRTRIASISTWTVIAASALMSVGEVLEATGTVNMEAIEPDGLTLLFAFVYMAYVVLFIASVVLIGMWIHRAHANLFAAGLDGLEYTPGWSVGWFFIPFANLVKPFQAMRELWNESHGADNSFGGATPPSVGWWWGTFLAGNILSNIGTRIAISAPPGSSGAATGLMMSAAGGIVFSVGGWFLLVVMREVLDAQRNHLQVSEAFA